KREADQDATRDRDAERNRERLRGLDQVRIERRRSDELQGERGRVERRGQRTGPRVPVHELPTRQQAGNQHCGAQQAYHRRRLASIFFSHRKNSVLTVAATPSTSTISGYITALSKLL